jgi:histidinol-phosphate aminotransferase
MRINLARNTQSRPSPSVRAVLADELTDTDLSQYPPGSPGHAPGELAVELGRRCAVDPRRILLERGAEGVLREVFRFVVLNHHKAGRAGRPVVALPAGSWAHYDDIAAREGAAVVRYPVVPCGEIGPLGMPRFTFDVDTLLALHARTVFQLALIPSIDNPTGARFPLERLGEVATALSGAAVAVDDPYCGFDRTEPAMGMLPRFALEHPNVVVVRSFSKAFGLAGKRIGWGTVGDDFTELAEVPYLGVDRTDEIVALAALRDVEHYAQVRSDIVADREMIYRSLPPLGVTVWESAANFVLVQFPAETIAAARRALDEADIEIRWLGGLHAGRARITIDTPEHTRALLRALAGALLGARSWHGMGHGPAAARFAAATSTGSR